MNLDQKFQQRWEFRRKEDDSDSSSNNSKSKSTNESDRKRHKLVSNLILPVNDEIGNSPPFQLKSSELKPNRGCPSKSKKATTKLIGSNKKKNAAREKKKTTKKEKKKKKKSLLTDRKKRTNNRVNRKPAYLEDLKKFMESILVELKDARENMFTSMKEEMEKLVEIGIASRTARKEGNCEQKLRLPHNQNSAGKSPKFQNCVNGSLERSTRSNTMNGSSNRSKALEEEVGDGQAIGANASNEKEKEERLRPSVKKPSQSFNNPDHVVSSSYLTLPTVLSKLPVQNNHRLETSYIQPGATGNNTSMNLNRGNVMIGPSINNEYFSSIQQEEQFAKYPQMGSKNMGGFEQHRTPTSNIGAGFPVPLHPGLDNGFNAASKVGLENLSRSNRILGLRMNGGAIRYSGGSYALENLSANNYCGYVNYKTDGV